MSDLWLDILEDAKDRCEDSSLKPSGAPSAEVGRGLTAAVPSLLLYAREDSARRAVTPRSAANIRTLVFDAEIRVAGAAQAAYEAAGPYIAWVVGSLDGVILEGSVRECQEEGRVFEQESQDEDPYLLVKVRFSSLYQQRVGDVTKAT